MILVPAFVVYGNWELTTLVGILVQKDPLPKSSHSNPIDQPRYEIKADVP